ncbi:MAG: threonine-phosphate decarboxylase CobD [Eubacteriales bacterium]|nr:threonine-phosphate decarboxylase CobD [Eubacteriales bacterium]
MTENRHGGDIYAEDLPAEPLDFSASINPLGMPEGVRRAAKQALSGCVHYPDPTCRALRQAIAQREQMDADQIFCSNGAADVLYRLLLALRPKKILLPAPTFAEYAQAATLVGSEIIRFPLQQSDCFAVPERFWDAVTAEIDLVVVCNPNNPTGQAMPKWLVKKGIERCAATGTRLLVDECFYDFLDEPEQHTVADGIIGNPQLIVLRSFTKMYAMPGLRLGYCLSSDICLLESLYDMGAPWSVSVIAQACGVAAARDTEFPARTRQYIARQRAYLQQGLQELGLFVVPGKANFLLCKNEVIPDLTQEMRKKGVLIRSCSNFPGLDERWFRVAVRTDAENAALLRTLRELKIQKEGVKLWQR